MCVVCVYVCVWVLELHISVYTHTRALQFVVKSSSLLQAFRARRVVGGGVERHSADCCCHEMDHLGKHVQPDIDKERLADQTKAQEKKRVLIGLEQASKRSNRLNECWQTRS